MEEQEILTALAKTQAYNTKEGRFSHAFLVKDTNKGYKLMSSSDRTDKIRDSIMGKGLFEALRTAKSDGLREGNKLHEGVVAAIRESGNQITEIISNPNMLSRIPTATIKAILDEVDNGGNRIKLRPQEITALRASAQSRQ